MYHRMRDWVETHERRLSFLALLGGFAFDNLTLTRTDVWWDNLLILFYILVAGMCIVILGKDVSASSRARLIARMQEFVPFVMQFALGGLFSVFFVFYSRSGSFETSWPFLMLLFGMLIGNEFFRNRYSRLPFQIAVYFVTVFSYMTFLVPIITKKMGDGIFFASTILSMLFMYLFLRILERIGGERVKESRMHARRNVIAITILFVVLYANNIIPPLPLALKAGGVYHNVTQTGKTYVLEDEARGWRDRLSITPTIHIMKGETLSVYSAVFSPTALNVKVVHHWQFYNETIGKWESKAKVSYPIVGGKDGGYRGYSLKTNVSEGLWRIDIETVDGRVIGRMKRRVVIVQSPVSRVRTITN